MALAAEHHNTRSACCIRSSRCASASCEISSPSCSAPAVSTRSTVRPPRSIVAVSQSRVVPAAGETIATSRFASALKSVLLPAFGRPARTIVWRPVVCPRDRECTSSCDSQVTARSSLPVMASRSTNSMSSSTKSSPASRSARSISSFSRRSRIFEDTPPASCVSACCNCPTESASITPRTASAWTRSILPARKARRVNSPGRATRAPRPTRFSTTAFKIGGDPIV